MFDYTVFIGRFQPIHNGHLKVIKQALEQSEKLIILVGSANRAQDIRNPFTYSERVYMIKLCLSEAEQARIFFRPLPDFMYQDTAWVEEVQYLVNSVVDPNNTNTTEANIALIGHAKDSMGYFLKMFPQWDSIAVTNPQPLNATDIRKTMFTGAACPVSNYFPTPVYNYIVDWMWNSCSEYTRLKEEYEYVQNYKKKWSNVPFPVIFQTVDNVVFQSGHVLMIERGGMPGKGLLALPGGFLNSDETLFDGALRELYEETQIKMSERTMKRCLVASKTFDDIYRSTRGRTITTSFCYKLDDDVNFPKVKGSDDAAKAMWIPISQATPDVCFEDHGFQIQYFSKLV